MTLTPQSVLAASRGLVVLDEIQRMPELFEALRPICDDPDRDAVFLLLGSASPDPVRGVSETPAGRILFVDMGGFSLAEVGPAHQSRLWLRGGLPRACLAPTPSAWSRWMQSFVRTFIERDIPALRPGVSPQRAFMIRILPPWLENRGKRLVKSPKVYLRDSGMLHYLLGIEERHDLVTHPRYGASWEGFALEQTLLAHGDREAYFKCTDTPRTTKSMHVVIQDLGLEHLWVVYPGDLEYPLADRITALPLAGIPDLTIL